MSPMMQRINRVPRRSPDYYVAAVIFVLGGVTVFLTWW